jgi:hypothetical protein
MKPKSVYTRAISIKYGKSYKIANNSISNIIFAEKMLRPISLSHIVGPFIIIKILNIDKINKQENK